MKVLTTLFNGAVRDNIILRRRASLSTLYRAVRDNIILRRRASLSTLYGAVRDNNI
jgi:hypothetical protein